MSEEKIVKMIFDVLNEESRRYHLKIKIKELENKINSLNTACGHCDKWMKSQECPKERNVNGRQKGPSIGDPRCDEFKESWTTGLLRDRWEKELNILKELNHDNRTVG